ncbi:MAG: hypothetical protein RLY20_875 [Verrucomicrobiota bacterium]
MKRLILPILLLLPALASAQVAPLPQGVTAPVFGLPSVIDGGGNIPIPVVGPTSCSTPAYTFSGATTSGYGFASSTACVVLGGTQRLGITTSGATFAVPIVTVANGTTTAPLTLTNGTLLATATANTLENDGAAFYDTMDTTNGRRYADSWNYFRLTGSGSGITTIADFFGSNSAIPLVANGIYKIEWNAWFSQATAGTATWTITTATTNLANLTAEYMCSNIAGIGTVNPPQTAGVNVTNSSATALPVTGSEANGATHYCKITALLTAGNGSSNTRLRLTMSAGTATPLINSYYTVRRLSGGNVGTFAP